MIFLVSCIITHPQKSIQIVCYSCVDITKKVVFVPKQLYLPPGNVFKHSTLLEPSKNKKYPKIPKKTQKYPKPKVYGIFIEKKSSPNTLKLQPAVRSRIWTQSTFSNGVKRLPTSFCRSMSRLGSGHLY